MHASPIGTAKTSLIRERWWRAIEHPISDDASRPEPNCPTGPNSTVRLSKQALGLIISQCIQLGLKNAPVISSERLAFDPWRTYPHVASLRSRADWLSTSEQSLEPDRPRFQWVNRKLQREQHIDRF
jgi:hypothetical protein